jgi:hypothetical protein
MKPFFILALGVLLFACTQTAPNTTNRRDLGALEVAFSDGVSSARFTPNRLSSQATAVNESQLTFTSDSQAAYIYSTQTDSRILVARFKITNATGANINRLTLVAWAKPTNIGQSAINSLTNFGGLSVGTTAEKEALVALTEPVHAINGSSANPTINSSNADLQLFSELENTSSETLTGLSGQLLPYGFVARNNSNTAANRRVVNSSNTNSDGQITIALRVPSNNLGTYNFRMTFRVIAEPTSNPIYVQSLEEQVAGTFGGEAVSSLPSNASLRMLPGGAQNLVGATMVNTRIAGSKGSPTGVIRPWLFNPLSNKVSVGFSELMTPSGFEVRRLLGPKGSLEAAPTPRQKTINFNAPSAGFASNEPLQMYLKNVQDRDGFAIFPSVSTRGYAYQRFAPASAAAGTCTTCVFNTSGTFYTLVNNINVAGADVAFANIDNDSQHELIVSYYNTGGNPYTTIKTFNPGSTTASFTDTISGVGLDFGKIVTGDLNNDNKIDFAVVSRSSASIAIIYTWLNTSTFNGISFSRTTTNMPVSIPQPSVGLADINGSSQDYHLWDVDHDGDLDLVLMFDRRTHVVLNNGDGTFGLQNSVPHLWATLDFSSFAKWSVADLDSDGDLDFNGINSDNGTKTYRQINVQTTDGTYNGFTSKTWKTFNDTTNYSAAGELADVNNDGYPDLVMNPNTPNPGSNDQLEVYLNNGLGEFLDPPIISTLPCTVKRTKMKFADINHDSKIDFVTRCFTGGLYGLVKGNGDGTFTASGTFSATSTSDFFFVDWDSDNDTDVVIRKVIQSSIGGGSVEVIVFTNN